MQSVYSTARAEGTRKGMNPPYTNYRLLFYPPYTNFWIPLIPTIGYFSCTRMALALNTLQKVDMPLNKETKPTLVNNYKQMFSS